VTTGPDQLIPVVDEGLGNSYYLFDLGDGRALAVDPPRDLRSLRTAATRIGLRVVYAAVRVSSQPTTAPRSWHPPPVSAGSTTVNCATATRSIWAG
jgi:hypothetical protein